MRRYDSYKDSEIEGLGDIPEHWEVLRIKDIATVRGRVGWKALKASEYIDSGYFFLATPNIKNKEIDYINVNYINHHRYTESPEIMLNEGDVLLVKDGSTLGIVNIVQDLPSKGTVNSSIAVLRLKREFNKFIYYLLTSEFIQNSISLKKEGMGVPHLFQKDINNFKLLLPTLNEQTQITNYLDTKTKVIDKKTILLEQKILKYKELRKSIINNAVTKGLDKDVKLKDSGIDCIGEIPEHWEVKRIKELGTVETSSVNKKIEENESLVKLVNYMDVYNNLTKEIYNDDNFMTVSAKSNQVIEKKLKKGDVLFTPSSETIEDIGVSSVVMENLKNTVYSYHILRLRFSKIIDDKFKKYMLNNDFVQLYFSKSSKGTTRKILGLNVFYNLEVLIPPLKEQKQIVEFLEKTTITIDSMIQNIEKQIVVLAELRKTLINDVVTGKLRVFEPVENCVLNN
ncbi:MAG: restriction endonuclease subunit S [Bacteroidetes bacterium]|nr:restriction endonuclease subunit S [Bacteroidota bacterium]